MSSAALDRLLAILLVAQLASGLLTLRSGVPATAPLFWLHGLVGGALLVAAGRSCAAASGPPCAGADGAGSPSARSWRCSSRRRWPAASRWVASGRILSIGPWTILTLHVWAALALSRSRSCTCCPADSACSGHRPGRRA